MKLLAEFVYLQLLDVLTTLAFLMLGVAEANPIVNWAMSLGPTPIEGLVWLKLAGVVLAGLCVWQSREKLLRRINIFFAVLVAYNLVVIILATPAMLS